MKMPQKLENVTGYDLFFEGDERLVNEIHELVKKDIEYPVMKSMVDNPVNGKVWALTVKWNEPLDIDMSLAQYIFAQTRKCREDEVKIINRRIKYPDQLKYIGMEYYCHIPK